MSDQPITGYRQLTADEVEQINQLKHLGERLGETLKAIEADNNAAMRAATDAYDAPECEHWDDLPAELRQAYTRANESNRALALAKTHLQTGLMWAVRGVAKPEGF